MHVPDAKAVALESLITQLHTPPPRIPYVEGIDFVYDYYKGTEIALTVSFRNCRQQSGDF